MSALPNIPGRTIFITTLFFVLPVSAEIISSWEKIDDEKGIQIYIKEIPESPIIIARGVAIFDHNILKIAGIVGDNTRFKEWVPRLLQVETLNEISHYEWDEYILLDAPWPVDDRELVLRKNIVVDQDGLRISFNFRSVASPLKPVNDKYIRAAIDTGSFTLTHINDEQTHIEVITHVDLKGLIPDWVINFIQRVWPLRALKGLKKQAAKNDIVHLKLQ